MLPTWRSMVLSILTLVGLAVLARADVPSRPGEWPQWRGPARDARSPETGLLSKWPKGGPRLIWEATDAGQGYSSMAVAHGLVYTLGNRDDGQYAIAYHAPDDHQATADAGRPETAQEAWATRLSGVGKAQMGDGPRSTPTIDGDRLYALTVDGVLACLDARTGRLRWRKDVLREFNASNIGWGISESPLVEGDMVIVTPGGRKATVAALDKLTGETIWTAVDPNDRNVQAAYASAVAATLAGVRQVVVFASTEAMGVRAKDGEFLWRYRGANNGTANCATPVVMDDGVFFSSSYGKGCGMVHIASEGGKIVAREVYHNDQMMNHHGGMVVVNGYIYGASDSTHKITCMDFETGTVAWPRPNDRREPHIKGSVAYADGHLYVLDEKGIMYLIDASPKAFKIDGRFRVPQGTNQVWSHPVIAGGKLYVRNQDMIWCYAIRNGSLHGHASAR